MKVIWIHAAARLRCSQKGKLSRREDLLPDDIDDPELLLRALAVILFFQSCVRVPNITLKGFALTTRTLLGAPGIATRSDRTLSVGFEHVSERNTNRGPR